MGWIGHLQRLCVTHGRKTQFVDEPIDLNRNRFNKTEQLEHDRSIRRLPLLEDLHPSSNLAARPLMELLEEWPVSLSQLEKHGPAIFKLETPYEPRLNG